MTMRKAIARLMIAALLMAVAGPGLAEAASNSQDSGVVKKQNKKAKSTQAKKKCVKTAPPFMYNPRFMNRGFFKCRGQ
jgi:uncharacterized low-complexity protein